jgi:hypothetical protein
MWNKLQLALERISLARQLTAFSVVTSAAALFIASAILIAYDASWSRERLVSTRSRSRSWPARTAVRR